MGKEIENHKETSNSTSRIDEVTVGSLVGKGLTFTIPYQQRGYRWRVRNLLELLSDLIEFIEHPTSKRYCLQPLAISEEENVCKIWDGQQRLTTLFLLLRALDVEDPYFFAFERDRNSSRATFMRNPIFWGSQTPSIDFFYIGRAYQVFTDCIKSNTESLLINRSDDTESALFFKICDKFEYSNTKEKLVSLLTDKLPDKELIFLWYVVPESLATEIFRDINSGKISLTNTELIKALLLSDNSPMCSRELTAAQFAEIESAMHDDNLWYMIQTYETKLRSNVAEKETSLKNGFIDTRNRLLRMDLLFNLVAGVSYDKYLKDPIASFRYFYDNKANLMEKWKAVRQKFQVIKAIYSNIESYHYLGFLTYCSRNAEDKRMYSKLEEYISLYENSKRDEFICKLRLLVKSTLNVAKNKLLKLDFFKDKESIRRVLLLHNIATLLEIFEKQNTNGQLHLDKPFEIFPYELLYRQTWHIEHINPATDNPLRNMKDQLEWIESVKCDYPDLFTNSTDDKKSRFAVKNITTVLEKLKAYMNDKKEDTFTNLYSAIIDVVENLSGPDKLKEKYRLGNYVLLDASTNTCFHNSLFPTKRRIIIAASGHKVPTLDHEVKLVYLLPCTQNAFMKFYSTYPSLSLTDWNQKDADAYEADVKNKLKDFLK